MGTRGEVNASERRNEAAVCSESKHVKERAIAPLMKTSETNLPYSQATRIKRLGLAFDQNFSFEEHLDRVPNKAKTRLAVLNKEASCSWGLETGMIRLTGKSMVLSLLRYGLTLVGSGLAEKTCVSSIPE